jgi:exodeoxyribonuclease III
MKIITWNVNSVHTRLPRLIALLARHEPGLVCLQEIKTTAEAFPTDEIAAAGYQAVVHGQAGRNGVAVLARGPVMDVVRGFAGDPVPEQARVLSVTADGLRVVCVYVVNGKEVAAPEYDLKLRWLDALADWLRDSQEPTGRLIVAGDFNVTPDDRDVYDPEAWRGRNLASEPERARIRRLLDWGLIDLARSGHPGAGPYTFWDYRAGAFHRGWGLRIDLALATAQVAARCIDVTVDRDERKPTFGEGKPSDHAPLIVTLED